MGYRDRLVRNEWKIRSGSEMSGTKKTKSNMSRQWWRRGMICFKAHFERKVCFYQPYTCVVVGLLVNDHQWETKQIESEPVGDELHSAMSWWRVLCGHHSRRSKIQVERRLAHQYPSAPALHDACGTPLGFAENFRLPVS